MLTVPGHQATEVRSLGCLWVSGAMLIEVTEGDGVDPR